MSMNEREITMGVIDTRKSLRRFIEKCKNKTMFESTSRLQKEVLCDPILHPFSKWGADEVHDLLMSYGLFHADQWRKVEKSLESWDKEQLFSKIEKELGRLRKKWNGPDVPVYLYPIHESFIGERENKGGVAFQEAVYLFYGQPKNLKDDWRSILAHEYHHACRLTEKKVDLEKVSLLESVIIEGLAEYAVYDTYGARYTAPWVNQLKEEELLRIWKEKFVPELNLRGQQKHREYLYGNRMSKLPRWIGYQLGYKIIESYHASHPKATLQSMTKMDADDLLLGTKFNQL
ncbi:DUF2268 domain-containing protein [Halobacillus locisalis]|uniref:DUF2268 domain-containing protein n=1 Tax=Halobacillus locisalis TaxID=220753 RepID=A0A838CV16_9BACI|nr:DUF2268 domain-containing putative Zn-dependent protease [Halobacillus locisalis]MBA2175456.1 DUF2268 domain-containing protein [Halobacillus locisalis]